MGKATTMVWVSCVVLGLVASGAQAQAELSHDQAIKQLDSSKADEVRAAIEALGLAGKKKAVAPLSARIRRGLPGPLLDMALDTLSALGSTDAGPVLIELTRHRRADVRLKAIDGVLATKPDGAGDALVACLSDQDARVRGQAATGLGEVGDGKAVDTLFLALERGVLEAAPSIGRLAEERHVDRLTGFVGQLPFDVITPALSELLARKDVKQQTKLSLIAKLGELATPEVKGFLEAFAEALPPKGKNNKALRQAALDAVSRIAG